MGMMVLVRPKYCILEFPKEFIKPPYYAHFLFHYAYQKLKEMKQRSSLLMTKISMHVCVYCHDCNWSTLHFLFSFRAHKTSRTKGTLSFWESSTLSRS